MDDVDGALFSRVRLVESLDSLVDCSALPVKGVSEDCISENKYSKLENSNITPQLNRKNELLKSRFKQNEETIIKRESSNVLFNMPPGYKDTETRVKINLPILQMSSRASAPCGLNTEFVDKPVDIRTRHKNTECIPLTSQTPLFNGEVETKNVSSENLNIIGQKKSDSKKTILLDPFEERKTENNTSEQSHREISHRAILSSSYSFDSSNSFGNMDSSIDTEHIVDELPSFPFLTISDGMNESDTSEQFPVLKKDLPHKRYNSIESIEKPNPVSFVSYLNENDIESTSGAALFTLDKKTQNGQNSNIATVSSLNDKTWKDSGTDTTVSLDDKTLKDAGTDTTDASGKQCTDNMPKSNMKTPIDPLENHTMLQNNKKTKRKKAVICRLVTGLAVPLLSLLIYIWDIGSDIRLAIAYKEQGDMDLFWITAACIVLPVILMSIVDISWLWLDTSSRRLSNIVRYILAVFTLGRIVRSVIYMWHIFKSVTLSKAEEKLWHKKRATEEKRDCYMLDFFNAFAESVPQLFVQLYLMYAFDLQLTKVRTLNLLSSWASIAWTYSAYYKCNREVLVGKQDIKITGFAIFFMSVLSALAARVISVVLFLIYFKSWIGVIVLTVHFIYMLLWIIFKENPTLEGTTSSKFGKYLYCIFFAYVSLLCFLNLRNSRAKFRMAAFYLLIYIENFTFAVLTCYKMYMLEVRNDKLFNLIALPVGFVLHVFLLVIYYQIFHPKTGRC